jgi:hypothetical protein
MPLTLPADRPALARREQLLAAHQELRISAGTGYWQAEIIEPRDRTIITRYGLDELLDRVEKVLAVTRAPQPPPGPVSHPRDWSKSRAAAAAPTSPGSRPARPAKKEEAEQTIQASSHSSSQPSSASPGSGEGDRRE